jgi:hypothetical protein
MELPSACERKTSGEVAKNDEHVCIVCEREYVGHRGLETAHVAVAPSLQFDDVTLPRGGSASKTES